MSKGIDIPIDRLLVDFTSRLWVDKANNFRGRIFRNERNGSISPEFYISAIDYIEVLKDNSFDGQIFFDVQPTIELTEDLRTADVWICFMVNLKKLYPSLTRTEATEQAHLDTQEIIRASSFDITGMITGISGFSDYDWGRDGNGQSKADMSPHYLFRYNTKLEYQLLKC